jgi:hypothetical protein
MKATVYGTFLKCHSTPEGEIEVRMNTPHPVQTVQLNIYEAEQFALGLLRLCHRQQDRFERQERKECAVNEVQSVGYSPRD